ncbi:Rieske 2Fe-2S domain-containing protein [Streptomyces sp. MZ04]|uniref:Rieske 2Fe-2S domain-containing protein n=1 Tax=Streptomyces sp. MZ04 TaxID=2559236 RepID=UPI00107E830F|nr:Rieske 2Fe-2S domain-containing protein [Streptomyces sp. MZ04]TGB14738.1 Rieske family ferredoxin [Streptomyces sp. MZ04]
MPEWIAVCGVDDIDLEDVVPFRHEGNDYAVYRSPDNTFFATAGHCTHERQLLCDGLVMDGVIECPKHNGRFDYTTGRAQGAPAMTDLPTYQVKIEAGTVHIEIG